MQNIVMPIEIDPDTGLHLIEGKDGNRQRFASVFRTTWLKIPDADRQIIADWWQKGFACRQSPRIELLAAYTFAAAAESFGHHLNFNSAVCDAMPDTILSDLISHELAHVFHYAQSGSFANKIGATHQLRENEADSTANSWGFNMANLRGWANDHSALIVNATGNTVVGW
jgi:hypothetical protein